MKEKGHTKKLDVESLIIEVGRNCTMNCAHCLRGPKENKTISFNTVKSALDQIESIDSITFTGGEPFLYPDIITKTIDYIMTKEIPCYGFYIATNATIYDQRIMAKLCDFFIYCEDCGGEVEYTAKVEISNDRFHENNSIKIERMLKMFSFVDYRPELASDEYLIPEGNALINGYGEKNQMLKNKPKTFEWTNGDGIEMIYINVSGQCYPDCDLSYARQIDWNEKSNKTIPSVKRKTDIYTQIDKYNDFILKKEQTS